MNELLSSSRIELRAAMVATKAQPTKQLEDVD